MTCRATIFIALLAATASPLAAQNARVEVTSREARSLARGAPEIFTGTVSVDLLFRTKDGTRATGAHVTFAPGARSAWHTHPAGQALIVTTGVGWVQEWQGPKREIREGDVVWTPAGVKHWHGATASTSMTHIAIQEVVDDQNVAWLELVTDTQYLQPAAQEPPRQGSP